MFVRIDDPLWLVTRETARYMLREAGLHLTVPAKYEQDMEALVLEMSDYQPAKTEFPTFSRSEKNEVSVFHIDEDTKTKICVAYIGLLEPDENVRWVKATVEDGWMNVLNACKELHEAGYPGCVGCGGPNAELPWNEAASRKTLV